MSDIFTSFKNQALLSTALTHRSALNENLSDSSEHNERLEFLGDAVLELVTTEFLFAKLSHEPEGQLTAYRSALVRTETLADLATQLALGDKLFMSRGEEATGGRQNTSILADSMEALLGALYLDQGYQVVKNFLTKNLFTKFEQIKAEKLYKDAKSLLQESVQAKGLPAPVYEVISAVGPDHDKTFTIQVSVDGQVVAKGVGRNKQSAQQAAAREALPKWLKE